MTPTMKDALKSLAGHGGEGVIDNLGRVFAAGEVLGLYYEGELASAFSSVTWLRLCALGYIEGAGPNRIKLTDEGRRAAA